MNKTRQQGLAHLGLPESSGLELGTMLCLLRVLLYRFLYSVRFSSICRNKKRPILRPHVPLVRQGRHIN